jgi:hypothetical protein
MFRPYRRANDKAAFFECLLHTQYLVPVAGRSIDCHDRFAALNEKRSRAYSENKLLAPRGTGSTAKTWIATIIFFQIAVEPFHVALAMRMLSRSESDDGGS